MRTRCWRKGMRYKTSSYDGWLEKSGNSYNESASKNFLCYKTNHSDSLPLFHVSAMLYPMFLLSNVLSSLLIHVLLRISQLSLAFDYQHLPYVVNMKEDPDLGNG